MPSSTVTISGNKTGLPSGSVTIGLLTISNSSSGGAITELAAVSGANTVTVPGTTYIGCILVPAAGNTMSLTLKGITGDTGVPLHLTNPTLLSFPAGTTSFVITASGAVNIEIQWF